MSDYEGLGVFYLGDRVDQNSRSRQKGDYLLYESRDLCTHAIAVGMTGSGKTGLGISILEEAALDGIPALIIDPKGDMSNLCLGFESMSASDFLPWVHPEEAEQLGISVEQLAYQQAELWEKGLAGSDMTCERIEAMKRRTAITVYTPASTVGVPLSVLNLLDRPSEETIADSEALAELISGTASSLLGLLGLTVDPLLSREHIFISNLLSQCWLSGRSLDLATLIGQIQRPPFDKLGVMDLEGFYPQAERAMLAMRFNNFLASPGFAQWMQGEPLNIDRLLYTESGRPRLAIISIAHLGESERMFFVSLLLNQLLAWVRRQRGSSSLRALFYMDEIFGYFPPVQNPPSKTPLLSLLKQARAYGLGLILATQNPVDLDYKGLGNIGTWFVGRLQTERDKMRLLDGLEGAMAESGKAFNRQSIDQILSSLGKRHFLLHNIHDSVTQIFETRFCMSYLRGPLSRAELLLLKEKNLYEIPGTMASARSPQTAATQERTEVYTRPPVIERETSAPAASPVVVTAGSSIPLLPTGIPVYYLPAERPARVRGYRAELLGLGEVFFEDNKNGVRTRREQLYLCPFNDGPIPLVWNRSEISELTVDHLRREGEPDIRHEELMVAARDARNYKGWGADFEDFLYRNSTLTLYQNRKLKAVSRPDEDERSFRIRIEQERRENRDLEMEKLKKKYATRLGTLTERARKAEQAVEREEEQAADAKRQTAISMGSTVLSALFGRKILGSATVSSVASAGRAASRTSRATSDVERAKESLADVEDKLKALENEMQEELDRLTDTFQNDVEQTESLEIRPLKRDCKMLLLALAWRPIED